MPDRDPSNALLSNLLKEEQCKNYVITPYSLMKTRLAEQKKSSQIAGLQNSLAMRLVRLQVLPQVRQPLRQLQCQHLRQR